MRFMTIPPDADVDGVQNMARPTITFEEFFLEFLFPNVVIKNANEARSAEALVDKLVGAAVGSEVKLADAEYEAMEKALVPLRLEGRFRSRVVSFYSAIFDAATKSKKPKAEPEEEPVPKPAESNAA